MAQGITFPAGHFDTTLNCPICDFHCVHLVSCIVEQRDSVVCINHDRFTHEAVPPSGKRGSVISIEGFCEDGHHFLLTMMFHKGSTFVHHDRLADCEKDDELGFLPPEELWRD